MFVLASGGTWCSAGCYCKGAGCPLLELSPLFFQPANLTRVPISSASGYLFAFHHPLSSVVENLVHVCQKEEGMSQTLKSWRRTPWKISLSAAPFFCKTLGKWCLLCLQKMMPLAGIVCSNCFVTYLDRFSCQIAKEDQ